MSKMEKKKCRGIDQRFINDLKWDDLSFFLEQIKTDPKICLCIRNNYINIYYRGGNLLKISQKPQKYIYEFNPKYLIGDDVNTTKNLPDLNPKDKGSVFEYFKACKKEMDNWFLKHPKAEREIQQKILDNNPEIIDIEYVFQHKDVKRFNDKNSVKESKSEDIELIRPDMIMVHNGVLYIVENKFGDHAMGGTAGIKQHYGDMCEIAASDILKNELIESMVNITNAKNQLGLSDYVLSKDDIKSVELLFVFVEHNKKSTVLNREINAIEKIDGIKASKTFLSAENTVIDFNHLEDLFADDN